MATYSDNFTGTAQDLTNPWTQIRSTEPVRRDGAGIAVPTNPNKDSAVYYNGTVGTNQYSQVKTMFTGTSGDAREIVLVLRWSGAYVTTGTGYWFLSDGASYTEIHWGTTGIANFGAIKSDNSFTYVDGDTIKFSVTGTLLTVSKNGTIWAGLSVAHTSPMIGYPGFGVWGAAGVSVDDWEGGDVPVATTSGTVYEEVLSFGVFPKKTSLTTVLFTNSSSFGTIPRLSTSSIQALINTIAFGSRSGLIASSLQVLTEILSIKGSSDLALAHIQSILLSVSLNSISKTNIDAVCSLVDSIKLNTVITLSDSVLAAIVSQINFNSLSKFEFSSIASLLSSLGLNLSAIITFSKETFTNYDEALSLISVSRISTANTFSIIGEVLLSATGNSTFSALMDIGNGISINGIGCFVPSLGNQLTGELTFSAQNGIVLNGKCDFLNEIDFGVKGKLTSVTVSGLIEYGIELSFLYKDAEVLFEHKNYETNLKYYDFALRM